MKSIIVSVTGLLCTLFLQAASITPCKVTGTILEKTTGMPIEFAEISIYQAGTDKFVTGTVSNPKGQFTLGKLSAGNYYITYSYLGYEKQKSAPFSLKGKQGAIDFGKLYLAPAVQQLNEVVIQGKRSTYIQSIDKKVFNVGKDLMSASGSISDLMQNIPSVQVDVEGNVSLRGNGNVEILINGKPSTLMNARTRADVLQQLPANEVERIEVITNPSAQYKPDGVSGIINIVMNKQKKTGMNGSVIANIGTQGRKSVRPP